MGAEKYCPHTCGLHELWSQHALSQAPDLSRENVELRGQLTQAAMGDTSMRLKMQEGVAERAQLFHTDVSARKSRQADAQRLADADEQYRPGELALQQAVL